jgi:hypothetical protein
MSVIMTSLSDCIWGITARAGGDIEPCLARRFSEPGRAVSDELIAGEGDAFGENRSSVAPEGASGVVEERPTDHY